MRNDGPGGAVSLLVPPSGVTEAGGARGRALIEDLRVQIRALEQVPVSLAIPPAPGAVPPPPRPACFFPFSSFAGTLRQPLRDDARLLDKLKHGGLHEIRAEAYRDYPAALSFALAAIAGRWTTLVLRNLMSGDAYSYTELAATLPSLSDKVLSDRLNALVSGGLVERTITNGFPPRTEYRITDRGRELRPLLIELYRTGLALQAHDARTDR